MIDISNVSKKIDDKYIIKDINLHVNKGSIFGIIGENGAGKTTLIKCLTGIYKVTEGSIKINGEEVFDNNNVKQIIGYVSDENQYFSFFRVSQLVELYNKTYTNFSMERFYELNKKFKIPERKRIRELSKGMKMRTSLLLNLSIQPQVLILDEPTSGLDAVVQKEVLNIILDEVALKEVTVFVSSHYLDHIERICDNIAIIKNGEMKLINSMEQVKNSIKKLQVVFKDNKVPKKDLSLLDNVIKVENIGRVNYIVTKNYTKDFEKKLYDMGADFIEVVDMSLEDIFIYLVEGEEKHE
ncbi:ABC transporter ATP-binding protein (plasmid) [Haloimpatiens sp. FM7330]|uniref:ABC transporter ATP-binding protein n=1 Tax=Haloimpatiens sp. FM7330 TaxID=3298610 RepID=UPI0036288CAD